MAKEFTNNKPINYLRINKDGLLYIKSDEPKEGYEEVKLQNGNSTFHKTFSATEDGKLSYIGITEKEFKSGKVKLLELVIEGETMSDKLSFELFKQNGGLSSYVKNIATLLPNLDFSERINIVPSRKKNDRGYAEGNLFINYSDRQGEDSYVKFAHMYGEKGDIPSGIKVTAVDGSERYDFKDQDTYLYKILLEQIERFKTFKGVNTANENTPKPSAPAKSTTPSTPVEATSKIEASGEEHDDLPF